MGENDDRYFLQTKTESMYNDVRRAVQQHKICFGDNLAWTREKKYVNMKKTGSDIHVTSDVLPRNTIT